MSNNLIKLSHTFEYSAEFYNIGNIEIPNKEPLFLNDLNVSLKSTSQIKEELIDKPEKVFIEFDNIKDAWKFLFRRDTLLLQSSAELLCEFNRIILSWIIHDGGIIRNKPVYITNSMWQPPIPFESQIVANINDILNMDATHLAKAIELLLYIIKFQPFYDGNKRTAFMFANHYLISNGIGVLQTNADTLDRFAYYLIGYFQGYYDKTIQDYIKNNFFIPFNEKTEKK